MTEIQRLAQTYTEKTKEITEKCDNARSVLKELGFLDTMTVQDDVFKKVFDNRYPYSIHEIQLMAVDKREDNNNYYLQFMVKFKDDDTSFIYVEVK